MKYKGIELEGLDKKVKLSHGRVMETDEGTDWIDKLLTCDKAALTPTRFHEVSALSSVINMDYQICNGQGRAHADPVPRGQRPQLRHQYGLPDLQRRHRAVRLQRLPRVPRTVQR